MIPSRIDGRHVIVDYWGCDVARINSSEFLKLEFQKMAQRRSIKILNCHIHSLSPNGLTALWLVNDSHMGLHTWPERNFAAFDFFNSAPRDDLSEIIEEVAEILGATSFSRADIGRGDSSSSQSNQIPS